LIFADMLLQIDPDEQLLSKTEKQKVFNSIKS